MYWAGAAQWLVTKRLFSLPMRLRESLFFVPMAFVLGAVMLGIGGVELDRRLVETDPDLPFGLTLTVDSARAVLTTIGSATITFAGVAFSISLLVIQLASSQYSPRIVHGLLRDPFSKRVMGIVIGTFTYCLVVLRSVRGPLEDGGEPVIPNISVLVAVILGVISILAIIAFIDHSARSMNVSRILESATSDAVDSIERLWDDERDDEKQSEVLPEPPEEHFVVDLAKDGWITRIDFDALVEVVEPGGTVRLEVEVGRYAVTGTPLCALWPVPDDVDGACARAREAVVISRSRSVEKDIGYGVRQLADVALRALSPGINDPTTAQDAVFHMGSVLREVLVRQPPRLVSIMRDGRRLLRPERLDHEQLIDLAFDEIRLVASGQPTMCRYLLELLRLLEVVAADSDATQARAAIRRQAALIREGADRAELGDYDADKIRAAHDARFGSIGR